MSQPIPTGTPTPSLTLCFDFLSSFSYLAFNIIHKHPLFNNPNSPVNISYKPTLLPSLFRKAQNPPPIQLGRKSLKQSYLVRDFQRKARVLGVPVIQGFPKGFPALDTRPLLRTILILQKEYPTSSIPISAISAIYNAIWRDGKDFSTKESALENTFQILLPLLGNDKAVVEQILKRAEEDKEIAGLLEENVQQVFDQGGFGLPWLQAKNEKGNSDFWWGVDQLAQAAGFLELLWPEGVDQKEKVGWML